MAQCDHVTSCEMRSAHPWTRRFVSRRCVRHRSACRWWTGALGARAREGWRSAARLASASPGPPAFSGVGVTTRYRSATAALPCRWARGPARRLQTHRVRRHPRRAIAPFWPPLCRPPLCRARDCCTAGATLTAKALPQHRSNPVQIWRISCRLSVDLDLN